MAVNYREKQMRHYRQEGDEYMAIILRLDRMMADRKISLNDLAEKVGISNVNLSNIKTGKVSAIRFSTLNAICDVLECQPGICWNFREMINQLK